MRQREGPLGADSFELANVRSVVEQEDHPPGVLHRSQSFAQERFGHLEPRSPFDRPVFRGLLREVGRVERHQVDGARPDAGRAVCQHEVDPPVPPVRSPRPDQVSPHNEPEPPRELDEVATVARADLQGHPPRQSTESAPQERRVVRGDVCLSAHSGMSSSLKDVYSSRESTWVMFWVW